MRAPQRWRRASRPPRRECMEWRSAPEGQQAVVTTYTSGAGASSGLAQGAHPVDLSRPPRELGAATGHKLQVLPFKTISKILLRTARQGRTRQDELQGMRSLVHGPQRCQLLGQTLFPGSLCSSQAVGRESLVPPVHGRRAAVVWQRDRAPWCSVSPSQPDRFPLLHASFG